MESTTRKRSRTGPVPQWTERLVVHLSPDQLEATRNLASRNGRSLAAEVRAALIAHHAAVTPHKNEVA